MNRRRTGPNGIQSGGKPTERWRWATSRENTPGERLAAVHLVTRRAADPADRDVLLAILDLPGGAS